MAVTINGDTGITSAGGYTGDGVVLADNTPANTLVTTTGGNVGIGTSSPSTALHVNGTCTANALGGNAATGSGASGTWNISVTGNAASASNAVAKDGISTAGMASNDPLFMYMRRISDNDIYYLIRNGNGSLRSGIRSSGYLEWNTDAGAVGTNYFASDIRKKNNIAPSVFNSSAVIAGIEFIEFDWKPESGNQGHVDVGVSAQQLQQLDNRLVNELSDGSLMVNEPALVAHMAKAIQEQQALIIQLQADVAALKGAA
jgi:hypothetical protein